MKIFVKNLSNSGASLTAYLHNISPELSTADIRPAVLIFPGGGYYSCSDREAEPIALAYSAEGYNAFVCRYSVGLEAGFSEAFEDAQEALALMHSNADEWNIDKEKIAVAGFSAGGHLAAAVAAMGSLRPTAVILGYPVVLASMGNFLGKTIPGIDEIIDENMPPVFAFATRNDRTVPIENTLALANALDKAECPFELHVFENGEHGFSLAKPHTANGIQSMHNPIAAQWFAMSVTWLKYHLGDFKLEHAPAANKTDAEELGIKTPLYILFRHEGCVKILEQTLPAVVEMAKANEMVKQVSIQDMASKAPEVFTEELLKKLDTLLCGQQ